MRGPPKTWLSKGQLPSARQPTYIYDRVDGRRVLYSPEEHHHDGKWAHMSISRPDRLPSWDELREAKNDFFGEGAMVVQILPPEKEYVNQHPFCLHLWQYLDGPSWPLETQ